LDEAFHEKSEQLVRVVDGLREEHDVADESVRQIGLVDNRLLDLADKFSDRVEGSRCAVGPWK
jgi:hypothetical protein